MPYRPSLSEDEIAVLRTALNQYSAGKTSDTKRALAKRLWAKLTDRTKGNPCRLYGHDYQLYETVKQDADHVDKWKCVHCTAEITRVW